MTNREILILYDANIRHPKIQVKLFKFKITYQNKYMNQNILFASNWIILAKNFNTFAKKVEHEHSHHWWWQFGLIISHWLY